MFTADSGSRLRAHPGPNQLGKGRMFNFFGRQREQATRIRKLEIDLARAEGVSAALVGMIQAILLLMPSKKREELIGEMKSLVGEGIGLEPRGGDTDEECVHASSNAMSHVLQIFIKTHERRKKIARDRRGGAGG
jgi:hypothetical protein